MRTWRLHELGRAGGAAVLFSILIPALAADLGGEKTIPRERIAGAVRASAGMEPSSKEWLHLQIALFPLKRQAGEAQGELRAHLDAALETISAGHVKAAAEERLQQVRCYLEALIATILRGRPA